MKRLCALIFMCVSDLYASDSNTTISLPAEVKFSSRLTTSDKIHTDNNKVSLCCYREKDITSIEVRLALDSNHDLETFLFVPHRPDLQELVKWYQDAIVLLSTSLALEKREHIKQKQADELNNTMKIVIPSRDSVVSAETQAKRMKGAVSTLDLAAKSVQKALEDLKESMNVFRDNIEESRLSNNPQEKEQIQNESFSTKTLRASAGVSKNNPVLNDDDE